MQFILRLKPEDYALACEEKDARNGSLGGETVCLCFVAQAMRRTFPNLTEVKVYAGIMRWVVDDMLYEALVPDNLLRQIEIFDEIPYHSEISAWHVHTKCSDAGFLAAKKELRGLKPTFGAHFIETYNIQSRKGNEL